MALSNINKALNMPEYEVKIGEKVTRKLFVALLVFLLSLVSYMGVSVGKDVVTDADMQQWRAARFGMFIHWGAYSYLAGVWKGKPVNGYAEHIMRKEKIPLEQYKKEVVAKFNPQKFDADEWVRIAKSAGMKYIVITAKHHDGFAMWDSALTDYDIMDGTSFGRDPMRELRDAARRAGLMFGFYYSHAQDWSHPYGQRNSRDFGHKQPQKRGWHKKPEWADYVEKSWIYVNEKSIPQMEELIQKYDPDIMWFDTMAWLPRNMTKAIIKRAKALKPDMIINSRGTPRIFDYKSTNDRPEYFQRTDDPYWEAIPTTNNSYGYHAYDKSHKPASFFVALLVRAAARGGNLLMNVGPMGDGRIDPIDVKLLGQIGAWLIPNGEAIYSVDRTPLAVQAWGDTTVKGDKLYLHILNWPMGGDLVVGGLMSKVKKAYLLRDEAQKPLPVRRLNDMDVAVSIRETAPDKLGTVIVLELNGPPHADNSSILLSPGVSTNMIHVFEGILHGKGMKWGGGNIKSNFIEKWPSAKSYISWDLRANETGRYKITARYTGKKDNLGNIFTVEIAGQRFEGRVEKVGKHLRLDLGHVDIAKGRYTLTVRAKKHKPGSNLVYLTDVSFIPEKL